MAKRKKKAGKPRINPKLKAAVEAAYKLGQMNMADEIYKQIREGSLN